MCGIIGAIGTNQICEVILNGLKQFPNAVGAHGKLTRKKTSWLKNSYAKLFFLFYLSNSDCLTCTHLSCLDVM